MAIGNQPAWLSVSVMDLEVRPVHRCERSSLGLLTLPAVAVFCLILFP